LPFCAGPLPSKRGTNKPVDARIWPDSPLESGPAPNVLYGEPRSTPTPDFGGYRDTTPCRMTGDTTPCRMTGDTTPCRMTGVTLHSRLLEREGVFFQRAWERH